MSEATRSSAGVPPTSLFGLDPDSQQKWRALYGGWNAQAHESRTPAWMRPLVEHSLIAGREALKNVGLLSSTANSTENTQSCVLAQLARLQSAQQEYNEIHALLSFLPCASAPGSVGMVTINDNLYNLRRQVKIHQAKSNDPTSTDTARESAKQALSKCSDQISTQVKTLERLSQLTGKGFKYLLCEFEFPSSRTLLPTAVSTAPGSSARA